jgi:hypothetical protein
VLKESRLQNDLLKKIPHIFETAEVAAKSVRRGGRAHERPQREDQLPGPKEQQQQPPPYAPSCGKGLRRRHRHGLRLLHRQQQQQPVLDPRREAAQVLQGTVVVAVPNLPPPRPRQVPHRCLAESTWAAGAHADSS